MTLPARMSLMMTSAAVTLQHTTFATPAEKAEALNVAGVPGTRASHSFPWWFNPTVYS